MKITYTPQVWDDPNRSQSLGVLPKLNKDDWPKLYAFMKSHWPDFELIGDYGEQRAKPGERWWGIGAIEVKEGVAEFQVQFRKDANTYDYDNILSLQWFGSAPTLDPAFDPRYYGNGNWAFSEGSGDTGWPYGASGPYSFWVNSDPSNFADRRVGSDCMDHVYWFDNHVSLNAVFWPMRKESTSSGYRIVNVSPTGEKLGYIEFTEGEPPVPSNNGGIVLEVDGNVVGYSEWKAIT